MPSQHGYGRLEAAQRAAGVPAALALFEEAGRALLLLAYRHRMPDSEIASRVGADPAFVAALREEQLERLVTLTGASSREAVVAWLEFVPEADLVAAGPGTALEPVPREGPRGDVWREAKVMLAVLAALLVLYAAAEYDPGIRPATVPGDRPPGAARVAVAPGHAAGRAQQRARGAEPPRRLAGRGGVARSSAGGGVAVRAPSAAAAPVRVVAAGATGGGGGAAVPGAERRAPLGGPRPGASTTAPPAPGPPAGHGRPPRVPEEGEAAPVAALGAQPAGPPAAVHSRGPHPGRPPGREPDGYPGEPPGHRAGPPPGHRGGPPPGHRPGPPPGHRGGPPPGHRGGPPPGLSAGPHGRHPGGPPPGHLR